MCLSQTVQCHHPSLRKQCHHPSVKVQCHPCHTPHVPRRQCSATGSPRGACTRCRCRRSDPAPGCAAPPACTAWTTWSGAARRTPSACPWPAWGKRLCRPSGHSSAKDPGPRWGAGCWSRARRVNESRKTPAGKWARNERQRGQVMLQEGARVLCSENLI